MVFQCHRAIERNVGHLIGPDKRRGIVSICGRLSSASSAMGKRMQVWKVGSLEVFGWCRSEL